MRTWLCILISVQLVFLFGSVAHAADFPEITPELKREANEFFLFDFLPSYRAEDCRVEFRVTADTGLDSDNTHLISRLTRRYFYEFEPRAAAAQTMLKTVADMTYQVFVQFADECDRRLELVTGLKAYIQRTSPEFQVEALEPKTSAGGRNWKPQGYWIDDPDYDAEFWENRRKAHRGDFDALIWMARSHERNLNPEGALAMYRWAVNCATNTRQRELALGKAAATAISLPADQLKNLDNARVENRDLMASFGLRCLP